MSKTAIFKTKKFSQWMLSSEVKDCELINAVNEMKSGLIDARLGGNVFKKRVSLNGKGKRSGARTIVATKFSSKWFFIFGFKKMKSQTLITKN